MKLPPLAQFEQELALVNDVLDCAEVWANIFEDLHGKVLTPTIPLHQAWLDQRDRAERKLLESVRKFERDHG